MTDVLEMHLREFFASDSYIVVDSALLGEKIVFAANEITAAKARIEDLVIYTAKELKHIILSGISGKDLIAAHKTKRAFGGKISSPKK